MVRITEIFCSIQGESAYTGWPTTFVRLTGCPMRCTYCDTAYAFHGGKKHSIEEIVDQVASYGAKHVTVTGGEPLAQPECIDLLTALCDQGYQVSLETGNAIDISAVDPRVYIVLDIKTPASGEESNNRYTNLDHLKKTDALKFVICDEADYQWSADMVQQQGLASRCEVFFSPAGDSQSPTALADWILRDKLPVRMQIQLHKVLWNNEPGR